MTVLEEKLNAIEGCRSAAALRRVVQRYIEDYGFSAFVIADLSDPWNEHPPFLTTYDKKWIETYFAEKFLTVDPSLARSKRTDFPFNWGSLTLPKATGKMTPAAVHVMNTVRDFGVLEGLTIPIHRRDASGGIQHIFCGLWWKDNIPAFLSSLKSNKLELHMLILYAVDKFLALHRREHKTSQPPDRSEEAWPASDLSDRELEVLKWAALGKTADETADILKCSRRTVEAHVTNAIRKLGAATKMQATVQAIYRGLIAL
jgi:DNA-binding CsgD family transcriptional regulator